VTTPSSRPPRSWNGEGVASWKVPLLRAEGGEKESQFGLVAPEDGPWMDALPVHRHNSVQRGIVFFKAAALRRWSMHRAHWRSEGYNPQTKVNDAARSKVMAQN